MAFQISTTLDKMTNRDKDFRFMALVDLSAELQKDNFKMDAESEKKVTDAVLKLLDDVSNQVQEQAVKCMGPLSKKIKESHFTMVDILTGHVLAVPAKGKEELRDLASISLKTVITNIPADKPDLPAQMVKRITPKLVTAISAQNANPDTVAAALDVLNTLLEKCGNYMTADHDSVLKVIQPELRSKRSATRKKATSCLGHLAVTTPDNMFAELVKNLVDYIGSSSTQPEELRTYMQAISAVSRSVGYRLGKYLNDILPKVMKHCESGAEDDELKENCFQCFESLILRCPKDITPFLDQIQKLCLAYVGHDPNYEDAMEEDEEEEEEEDDDDNENYSDDDDMSWKVRRSSTKCLDAIIVTRPERLSDLYAKVAPVLITRFNEREENVKLDVFSTFSDLLKQTGQFARRQTETDLIGQLRALVPRIVSGITKQLKGKQVKTRSGAFFLLKQLITVLPGALSDHISSLVPGVKVSLKDNRSDNSLKLETLSFLKLLMQTHDPKVFHPHVNELTIIFNSVNDQYYRTSAEALRVVSEFVHVLRPQNSNFDYKPYVKKLFNCTFEKLKAQEVDQEVKEAAISCMGLTLAYLGDELQAETPEVLKILVDRLSNEITRLTTVKSFETLASSPLRLQLDSVIGQVLDELASFLNRNNRQLVQTSLVTLGVVIRNSTHGPQATDQYANVLVKLSPLISTSDLHLTHLALDLTTSILKSKAVPMKTVADNQIVAKSIDLLKSTLLGGLALESLLEFFSNLVKDESSGLSFDSLSDQFMSIGSTADVSRQVLNNTAKAIAAITSTASADRKKKTVEKLINEAKSTKENTTKHLALFSLGEIGRLTDLSEFSQLSQSVLSAFESPSEETRQAASFALGGIAVGNLKVYVPKVVEQIKVNTKSKYLLLHSLRDIIVRQSANPESVASLQTYQKDILPILFADCESEEEGVRNVVAECLGKFALVSPAELVPALAKGAENSQSHLTRSTVVAAIKFAIVERPLPIDALLSEHIPKFLNLLSDPELIVRRNTLFTLNFIAHNKAILIREVLSTYLPALYGESKIKPELIREVDLGPFKHRVDDGLEIRKAAYEAMYTLLDTAVDRLSIPEFISHLKDGLNDQNDIKTLSHLMIIRLAQVAGPSLLESLEQLVEPLRATVTNKLKEGSVQTEVDRNEELIRSALRVVAVISRIPNVDSIHKWEEFVRGTLKTGELADKYASIKQEMQHTELQSSDKMDTS
ncbi:HEAT repeat-containing protein [Planoprotostelium fungivorum]|uniref:HEAT repeat-containing protein n=1 Tax=Planoprotostelium fungivorum TaxID=1890364 RepID=A0A2P6NRF6_9EUKA|nr:HEAT repeat-containing protein [Planoprotostelium fungivorum]